MNDTTKAIVVTVVAGILTYLLWEKWGRSYFLGVDATGAGAGGSTSGSGGEGGGGGSGGEGGAGGAGGSGAIGDYSSLAAAINALAAGVQLPNIKSAVKSCIAGTNEVVPYLAGQRVCVLAYGISGSGTITGKFRSGGQTSNLWEIDLSAPSGNSGANLATAWPGYMFATASNDPLAFNTDNPCVVSVSYWQENA
jgi:hypothetical protein